MKSSGKATQVTDHSKAIKFLRDNEYIEAAEEFERLLNRPPGFADVGEGYSALQTRCPACGEVCRMLTGGRWVDVYCKCVPAMSAGEDDEG